MPTTAKLILSMLLVSPMILSSAVAPGAPPDSAGGVKPPAQSRRATEVSPNDRQTARSTVLAASSGRTPRVVAQEVSPLQVNDTLPPPPGFSQASHCVALEGVHYIRKESRTLSPILAYDEKGKLVSLEYIVTLKDLQTGVSWKGLPGVAKRPVDHVDIDFYPTGLEGNPTPYYSVHMYFIGVEAQEQICPASREMEPVRRATQGQ